MGLFRVWRNNLILCALKAHGIITRAEGPDYYANHIFQS